MACSHSSAMLWLAVGSQLSSSQPALFQRKPVSQSSRQLASRPALRSWQSWCAEQLNWAQSKGSRQVISAGSQTRSFWQLCWASQGQPSMSVLQLWQRLLSSQYKLSSQRSSGSHGQAVVPLGHGSVVQTPLSQIKPSAQSPTLGQAQFNSPAGQFSQSFCSVQRKPWAQLPLSKQTQSRSPR